MRFGMWMGAPLRTLGMVAVMALAACGGGGDDKKDPPLGVTVTVDGTAESSGPLTAGETSTIEVPSGATLVFASEGETRWDPVATGSSYTVNSFSFTSKSMTVTSNAGGTLVVVFTNKADESQKATLNVTVAPKEFERVAPVDGETSTWADTWTNEAGDTTQSNQLFRTILTGQGGYGIDLGDADTGAYTSFRNLYDAQDRYLGYANTATGVECLYDTPVVGLAYPLQVGKSWSGDAKRDCATSSMTLHYSRRIEAYQRIVVPQGSHDTLRIKSESRVAVTPSNHEIPPYNYTMTSTCWWAVDIGRSIKCVDDVQNADGSSAHGSSELKSLTR